MRTTLFLLFAICVCTLHAQEDPTEIPKIFPSSPEASTLGKFGDVPINSAVGMASFSVPIYTIQEDNFELPIALSYQHNGLVIDQVAGHVGMGWNLNAGGMITRQVRGRPDEDDAGYIGNQMTGSTWVVPYYFNQLSQSQEDFMKELAADGLLDTEPDKFVVSAGNLNATFYFDENKNVVISPYKPYKISLINTNDLTQGFSVIDDQGVEFLFEASETTKRLSPLTSGENPAVPIWNGYTSGWKLTKVTTAKKRVINFVYNDPVANIQRHIQRSVSQSFKERITGNCSQGSASQAIRDYEVVSRLIKEITFPLGKLEFDNTIVDMGVDYNLNHDKYRSVLNGIELKNTFNQVISTFDLSYDNTNKTRKLLTEIELNNDPTNTYTFEYEGTPLDDIHWSKQDFWGYYNSNPTNDLIDSFNTFDLYGNRASDFSKSVIGSLKKITYPTKGYTQIEYESNTIDPGENGNGIPSECQSATTNTSISRNVSINWIEQNGGTNYDSQQVSFTIVDPYLFVDFNLRVEKISDGGDVYGRAKAQIAKTAGIGWTCADQDCSGSTPNPSYPSKLGCEGKFINIGGVLHKDPGVVTYNKRLKLDPGDYTLFVDVETYGIAFDTGDIIKSSAQILFYEDDGNPPPRSVAVGGTRVSKITTCPDNNPANCVEKEYIYETDEGISLGQLFRKRNITSYDYWTLDDTQSCESNWRIHSSSSNVPLGLYMGSHVFYNDVIEKTKTSSGASLGYSKKKYTLNIPQQNLTFPFVTIDNKEYRNGHLQNEMSYDNQDQAVSEMNQTYDFGNTTLNGINGEVYSLAIGRNATEVIETLAGTLIFHYYTDNVTIFQNGSDRTWLTSSTDKEWRSGDIFQIDRTFAYTNPHGHVKTEEVTQSDGSMYTNEYTYPYEDATTVNNLLVNANRLALPVAQDRYSDNAFLSKQESIFKNWHPDIIEPQFIKSQKGSSTLENRLVYHNFDTYGNPTDMAEASGMRTSYIWGYQNSLPIAKLENLIYNQIPTTTINTIQTLSNADDDTCNDGGTCEEKALRTALNNLRSQFPNVMITTYTYDPLVGPTSITDPKGYTSYYTYDDQNRLKHVSDNDGNVLEKIDYNYKN